MAATHRLIIQKRLGLDTWQNAYLLQEPDLDAAENFSILVLAWERSMHLSIIQFEYLRVSTVTPGDRIFRHIPLNLPGLDEEGAAQYLPLFAVVRMDMRTLDSDPARKYFKTPITEARQANGILDPGYVTALNGLNNTYFGGILDQGDIVTSAGNEVVGVSVHTAVQMRQLHRRNKKVETTP